MEKSGETDIAQEDPATVLPSSDRHSAPTSQTFTSTRPDVSDEASPTRYNAMN